MSKMKIDSKSKSKLVFASVLATGVFGVLQFAGSVDAKESAAALIDADWENCLRSHIEKRFFNLISASEDQRKALDALFEKRMDETRPDREKLRGGAVEFVKLFENSQASDKDIESKAQELRTMREKIADERLKTALKVREILTPEQRQIVGERIVEKITANRKSQFLRGM
jgi:Spy/CpxP family protein refolding chaperone